jgi:hypothetical protein
MSLGFARGTASVASTCSGLEVGGCLACDEGPDVLCTQIGMAGSRPPSHGFAIADGRNEALVVWAWRGIFTVVHLDQVLNADLTNPSLLPTGHYAVASVGSGFALAFVGNGTLLLATLDAHGALLSPATPVGPVDEASRVALVPFGDRALLLAHTPERGTELWAIAANGSLESPATLAGAAPRLGTSADGTRALILPYLPDGTPPVPGDVLVTVSSPGFVVRGEWHSDGTPPGIGTIEGTDDLDVTLPEAANAQLRVRMHASPTGTLDEVLSTHGRATRFRTRAGRRAPRGLYAPSRADQPPILDATSAPLRSLHGTLSIGFVPSFFPDRDVDPASVERGAQIPIALSGPGRGARGVRERLRISRRRRP